MAENQDRQHQANLQGLLRLAVTNTASNPDQIVDLSSRPAPLDPERREFLRNVLAELSTSAAHEMQKGLEVLQNNLNLISSDAVTDSTYPEMENVLDDLIDHTASIDSAIDFQRIGGFSILSALYNLTQEDILCKTSELVAELVQNNPECQNAAIEGSFITTLSRLVDSHPSEEVKIKALYALSCLIRQNKEAQHKFENSDGFSILLRAMQSDVKKLRIKIAFLLGSLSSEQAEYRDVLFKMGFVEQLVAILHSEHDDSHEHLLSALIALVSNHEQSLEESKREELGLQKLLKEKLDLLKGDDSLKDEYEYCQHLIKICFEKNNEQQLER